MIKAKIKRSGRFPLSSLALPGLLVMLCILLSIRSVAQPEHKADSTWVMHLLDSAYAFEGVNGDSALLIYQEALRVSDEINYSLGHAKTLHYCGIVYSDKSMYREALENYRLALGEYESISYHRGVGACYTNMGNIYRYQSKLDSALTNYQMALKIFQRNNIHNGLSQAYGNVGGVFQLMKQYDKAYDYHRQSANSAIQSKDSVLWCRSLINQGTALNDLNRPDESAAAHEKGLTIAHAVGDDYGIELANINLADHYKQMKDYSRAIEFGLTALKYALKLETPYDIADVRKSVGDIYSAMGNYTKAKVFYLEAITISEEIHATELSLSAYTALHKVSSLMGDYQDAYKYQTLAQYYQESVLGEKQLKIINELEVKYQTLQKDQELSRQQLELQQSRQYVHYSIGIALILLLLILLLAVQYRNRKKDHVRQLKAVKQEREIQVLQALMQGEEKERSRIARDLHDEVGGILAATKMHLNSLTMQVDIAKDRSYNQAVTLLDEASASVRKTAHNLMPEVLMQHGLDQALQRYCGSLGSDRNLTIQYDSWSDVGRFSGNFELSVYRIVQELLNNIIRHAGATEALVQLSRQDNLLSITVEDNGAGFQTDKLSGTGTGLASLQSRVRALNGKIDITSESGGGVSMYLEFDTKHLTV